MAIINPAIYGNGFHGSVLLNDSCMAVTDADLFTLGTCTKKKHETVLATTEGAKYDINEPLTGFPSGPGGPSRPFSPLKPCV